MNNEVEPTFPPTPAVTSAGREHIGFLDGVRGLAALYVCMSHVWIFGHDQAMSGPERLLRMVMDGGHSAVNVFIVLSGYCLMLPFISGKSVDVRQFFLMRAFRIIPPYFLCLSIAAVLGATLFSTPTNSMWDVTLPVTTLNFLAHVLMLHDWFPATSSKINYVFWSIGVEWKIYFLFPVLVLLGRRIGFMKMAIAAYVLTFALWIVLYRHDWLNPVAAGSSVYYLGLFAAGMATAVWVDKVKRSGRPVNLTVVFIVMLITSIGVFEAEFKHLILMQVGSFFGGILACFWIVWLSFVRTSHVRTILTSRAAVALGAVSYSLYLVHPIALQFVALYLIKQRATFSLPVVALDYAVSVILSLALAYAFYRMIELPSINWTRWAKRRGSVASLV